MSVRKWMRKGILIEAILVLALSGILLWRQQSVYGEEAVAYVNAASAEDDYIKWVDFTVSYDALCSAYAWDVDTHNTEHEICWIELLAYTAARTGANFDARALDILEEAADKLSEGECTMEELTENLEYYAYYLEAYTAVLGGMVGEYEEQVEDENGNVSFQSRYGLKAYFPLARGFEYTHYDDFGVSRSYGYKRKHLGHDMMGQTGTPIIAVESGTIEALGWNQYGGWRVGIRSLDGKRYYYYAHLRKDFPFNTKLKEGDVVAAGDVIGYLGMTGYSNKENVNNINIAHLHFGMQIIFDESQKDGNGEIWIDVYDIIEFLQKNKSYVKRSEKDKNFERKTMFYENLLKENGG